MLTRYKQCVLFLQTTMALLSELMKNLKSIFFLLSSIALIFIATFLQSDPAIYASLIPASLIFFCLFLKYFIPSDTDLEYIKILKVLSLMFGLSMTMAFLNIEGRQVDLLDTSHRISEYASRNNVYGKVKLEWQFKTMFYFWTPYFFVKIIEVFLKK